MNFSKEQKYKYKFLKSVWNNEYDKLYGYFLKYLEHSNNSYLIDSFNKISNVVQTGGAILDDEQRKKILINLRNILLEIYDKKVTDILFERLKNKGDKIMMEKDYDLDEFIGVLIDKLYSDPKILESTGKLESIPLEIPTKPKDDFVKELITKVKPPPSGPVSSGPVTPPAPSATIPPSGPASGPAIPPPPPP